MATTNIDAGVLVRCRPFRYYCDHATKATHYGPIGSRSDSGSFRVSRVVYAQDAARAVDDRLFEAIPE